MNPISKLQSEAVKKIKLTQGQFALIDNDDFERVSKGKWFANYVKMRD